MPLTLLVDVFESLLGQLANQDGIYSNQPLFYAGIANCVNSSLYRSGAQK
jgi:hypothetical protein